MEDFWNTINKCLRCENGYSRPLPDFDNVKLLISDNVRRKYFQDE